MASCESQKLKFNSLLGDLGKATMRGVRKCPKCNTLTGTRGSMCKNKLCRTIFKNATESKILKRTTFPNKFVYNQDAVRIAISQNLRIFSVKIDLNTEERTFVSLPESDDNSLSSDEYLPLPEPQCSLCTSLINNSCSHIAKATLCQQRATALRLQKELHNDIALPDKAFILSWLDENKLDPLVQRVSKCIMVVRKFDGTAGVPFEHVTFNLQEGQSKVICSCLKTIEITDLGTPYCFHIQCCFWAIGSCDKLAAEFLQLSNLPGKPVIDNLPNSSSEIATPSGNLFNEPVNANVLKPQSSDIIKSDGQIITQTNPTKVSLPVKQLAVLKPSGDAAELTASVSFNEWLASVTERIHQVMHYQFPGVPEPLVFHVPNTYFNCLHNRITNSGKKKRLPNSTTVFVRTNAVPIGTFTKHSWQITNENHVRQIFYTPQMPLMLTQKFVENSDGTYDVIETNAELESAASAAQKAYCKGIQPTTVTTFLKIGRWEPSRDETPFTIEWVADILPKNKIGELRIKLEYGHMRNGHILESSVDGLVPLVRLADAEPAHKKKKERKITAKPATS